MWALPPSAPNTMKAALCLLAAGIPSAASMTCGELKRSFKANQCCGGNPTKAVDMGSCWQPAEALLPGVMPSVNGRPKFIMAMDIDYPPYAYTRTAPFEHSSDLDEVVGVGADMIRAMGNFCGFDVEIVQAHWSDCWGAGEIGPGLLQGWYLSVPPRAFGLRLRLRLVRLRLRLARLRLARLRLVRGCVRSPLWHSPSTL